MSDQVPLGAKRVSNIAGILGIIKLRLGKKVLIMFYSWILKVNDL